MRAGRAREASAMLARRPDSLPTTAAYAKRLKLYRGEITPDLLITSGDTIRARAAFQRSVATGGWPAFGFIAAEQELNRLGARR